MANLDFKCPNCGGGISFDSTSQNMKCPFCDSELNIELLKSFDSILNEEGSEQTNWNTDSDSSWAEGEQEGLNTYICNSCGGEIVGDETLGSTHCPYCDNPVVFSGKWSGGLKPDLVIPFKIDKKKAIASLSNFFKGKILLPKKFKEENHLEEVKGLYVPFWLFSAETDSRMHFKGTKVRSWSDGNYNYTETSFFSIIRGGRLGFKDIPADASSKMEDVLMQSLEPFDTKEAVDFQTAYLAGFLADKYDVTSEDTIGIANNRIRQSVESELRKTVIGYTTLTREHGTVNIQNGKTKYALYPVWLLTTTWEGKPYLFAMNGQTGKFVGKLPINKKLRAAIFLGTFVGVTALFSVLLPFFM